MYTNHMLYHTIDSKKHLKMSGFLSKSSNKSNRYHHKKHALSKTSFMCYNRLYFFG